MYDVISYILGFGENILIKLSTWENEKKQLSKFNNDVYDTTLNQIRLVGRWNHIQSVL